MPMRTVGARFKLEGEDEFKRVMQQLNAGSSTLRSEMVRLQAEYKGNTDSVEFLTAKSELLGRQLDQQKQKTAATRAMHESASKAFAEAAKKVAELEQAHSENNEELEKAKAALADADLTLENYATKLNLAEAAEFNLQHEIDDTNKSLHGQGEEMTGLGDAVSTLTDKLGIHLPRGATNALNGMSKLSAGTVAAMGVATAGVMALVKSVKSLQEETIAAAARADDILTRATQMNISAQQYQAFQYASPFVDVDVDTLAGSLSKLTQEMGKVAAGGDDAKAKFYDLGVAVYNADGTLRDAYDVWLDTMDALSGMTNETERDVAAQDLLGKSASDLASIYRDGTGTLREYTAAAEENYIMSDEQLAALAAVDDAVQHLHMTQENNKNMIANEWAPAAKQALESFDRLVAAAGKALVESGIIKGFGELVQLATGLIEPIANLLGQADDTPGRLKPAAEAIHGIALMIAGAADAVNWFLGALQTLTLVGAVVPIGGKTGIQRMSDAAGFGYGSGNASNFQRQQMIHAGTWDQYASYYGRNATGNDNWRGGLTWVGESGPELVALPRGSQVYNAQDSRDVGGVSNYYINVNGIEELEQVVRWYEGRQVAARMKG